MSQQERNMLLWGLNSELNPQLNLELNPKLQVQTVMSQTVRNTLSWGSNASTPTLDSRACAAAVHCEFFCLILFFELVNARSRRARVRRRGNLFIVFLF